MAMGMEGNHVVVYSPADTLGLGGGGLVLGAHAPRSSFSRSRFRLLMASSSSVFAMLFWAIFFSLNLEGFH